MYLTWLPSYQTHRKATSSVGRPQAIERQCDLQNKPQSCHHSAKELWQRLEMSHLSRQLRSDMQSDARWYHLSRGLRGHPFQRAKRLTGLLGEDEHETDTRF